jgi:tetraacyldisaccharide 4'-kinase
MREPSFWWRQPGPAAALLAPVAAVYGAIAGARLGRRGWRVALPVVCVGNFTAGGAGKTPTALTVAQLLARAGERPFFLSRGYGGALAGPVLVDPARHGANEVGDEPLLLARAAPTIVARERPGGARLAVASGAGVVIMDDGFQNPSLAKDFSILVVDGQRGLGNGRIIPAGPLRAPLNAQLARSDALVVIGAVEGATEVVATARARDIPVFVARLAPDSGFTAALGSSRVLAFAGIGDPRKFFSTLTGLGIVVVAARSFPDHHRYTATEAKALCDDADRGGLALVTTEKDLVRITGDQALVELAARAHALPVSLAFEDEAGFAQLLLKKVAAAPGDRH